MKKTILLFSAFFIIQIAYSQSDFRRGYLITLSRDTIQGLINYHEGAGSYQSCDFRESERKSIINYSPGEISGYGYINDKFYERHKIDSLEKDGPFVFMEVIIRGKVSLYRYSDIFFVQKSDSALFRLSIETKEQYIDGKNVIIESKQYIGILNWILSDCKEVSSDLNELSYNEKSLSKLVVKYNKCMGTKQIEYKQNKKWTKFNFGLVAGIIQSDYLIDQFGNPEYLAAKYESADPFAGVLMGIKSPRISERISFQTEMHIYNAHYFSFKTVKNIGITEYYDLDFDISTLSFPISLMYSSPEKKNSWFVQAGIVSDIQYKSSVQLITESVSGQPGTVNTSINSPSLINKSLYGYWGGAGYQRMFNKFKADLAIRYYDALNVGEVRNRNQRITIAFIITSK